MGVVLKRFSFATLLLGALFATFFRARPAPERDSFDPRYQRMFELLRLQRHAMVLWSAHVIRDSTLARLATLTVEPGEPGIVTAGFPQGATSPEAAALVKTRWRSIGSPDSSVRVVVLILDNVFADSLRAQVYPYSGAMMAQSRSGDVCVAMTFGHLDPQGRIDVVESLLDRGMAPCLLRAAFGAPGRGVKEWLDRTRYAAAKSNAWLHRPRDFVDGYGQLPWEPSFEQAFTSVPSSGLSVLLRNVSAFEVSTMMSPPYLMGGPALRCLAGNEPECSRTVLDSVPLTHGLPQEVTATWSLGRKPRRDALLSPHPVGDWFLSDIIRWEGRERFARFWKSDAPFEAAFREAFGQELGSWTRAWGIRQRAETFGYFAFRPVILGSSLEPSWAFLVAGWTAIAVLIAAWTAKRRQVTA